MTEMELLTNVTDVREDDAKKTVLGKDELNLAEFPIALLSERPPKGVKTLEYQDQIFDGGKNRQIRRKLTIEGSETYGLPSAKDDEVILALIQLSKRAGFQDRGVEFTRFELIKMLGWANTGQSYARIELALHRWVSVTLHYQNAWWDKTEQRWTSGAFHIIDDFELNDSRETSLQFTLLPSRILWSDRVFGSFVDGHLKNIRYDVYVNLKSSISKRMYRFLDKRFHQRHVCNFDLHDFAHEHIGLTRSYRDCGKLKEKLSGAVAELEEIGFIEPMDRKDRYQPDGKGRWKVTFTKRSESAGQKHAVDAEKPSAIEPPHLKALCERGVTTATAHELIRDFTTEALETKIEIFDWLLSRRDKRVTKSPAGYLVTSIMNDYAVPSGYVSKAEQAHRENAQAEARKRSEEEQLRKRAEEKSRKDQEKAEHEAIDAYWKALSGEEQHALDAAAAEADPQLTVGLPLSMRKYAERMRREQHIRRILQDQGTLPVPK
jgi:Replication initiator protein A